MQHGMVWLKELDFVDREGLGGKKAETMTRSWPIFSKSLSLQGREGENSWEVTAGSHGVPAGSCLWVKVAAEGAALSW